MSTLALNFYPLSVGINRSSSSSEGKTLDGAIGRALRVIKGSAAQSLGFNDLDSLSAAAEFNGVECTPFELGERFLLALPHHLPSPELSIDPDGELAFDWFGSMGRNFSVSLSSKGRISFAGKLSMQKTIYGTDQFEDVVPREVIDAIRTVAATQVENG